MKEGEKRKKGKCVYFRTHRPTHQSLRPQAMANVVSLSLFLSFLFSFREFSQSQANFTLGTWRTRKEKSPDGRNAGGVTVAQEGALNGRRQQQSWPFILNPWPGHGLAIALYLRKLLCIHARDALVCYVCVYIRVCVNHLLCDDHLHHHHHHQHRGSMRWPCMHLNLLSMNESAKSTAYNLPCGLINGVHCWCCLSLSHTRVTGRASLLFDIILHHLYFLPVIKHQAICVWIINLTCLAWPFLLQHPTLVTICRENNDQLYFIFIPFSVVSWRSIHWPSLLFPFIWFNLFNKP